MSLKSTASQVFWQIDTMCVTNTWMRSSGDLCSWDRFLLDMKRICSIHWWSHNWYVPSYCPCSLVLLHQLCHSLTLFLLHSHHFSYLFPHLCPCGITSFSTLHSPSSLTASRLISFFFFYVKVLFSLWFIFLLCQFLSCNFSCTVPLQGY